MMMVWSSCYTVSWLVISGFKLAPDWYSHHSNQKARGFVAGWKNDDLDEKKDAFTPSYVNQGGTCIAMLAQCSESLTPFLDIIAQSGVKDWENCVIYF
jgi:hypothetical protein